MTNFNDNTVQNSERQKQNFDALKILKSTTVKDANSTLESLRAFKKRVGDISTAITLKKQEFAGAVKGEEATPQIVESAPVQPIEAAKSEPSSQPKQEVAADESSTEKKSKSAVTVEVTRVAPLISTPTPDGQKTFVDEKGNTIVRKFIKDRFPPKPPAQQGGQGQRPYNSNNRGTRPPMGQNGQQKPFDPNRPRQPFNRDGQQRPPFNNNRVGGATGGRPQTGQGGQQRSFGNDLPIMQREQLGKSFGNKNKTPEKTDSKRQMSVKSLIKRGLISSPNGNFEGDEFVSRRLKSKKQDVVKEKIKIEKAVITTQDVQIKVLSEKIGVTASEIIKQLFKEGIIKTINDTVDFDYAAVIASNFGVELELKPDKSFEELLQGAADLDDNTMEDNQKRPPIVTVLGHVDHGKTSLLDAIRKTNVTSGEAGGITQHIGAYTVKANGETITFIDTPGHAAFTAMRARGAQVTDVAILVVAADDGVMPQTIEALNHAKSAGVPIIVAVNKMDKPDANPDRVKQQLTEHGILPEEWGGDSIFVHVSAKQGENIDKLLESVLLVSEVGELKANSEKKARGTIIEAKLDKGRGPVATVLVQNGTLNVGDYVVAGTVVGKIRAMFDDKNKGIKSAGPSIPVEVLGFSEVPSAGDIVNAIDEKLSKQVAEERKNKERIAKINAKSAVTLDDLFGQISSGQLKNLNVILKTDVQGSLEALRGSLEKISNEEVKVCPIHGGVGAVSESDVMLARASNAIIIGFNVRPDSNAKAVAEREKVDIRLYSIIYDVVDDITAAMKGMLAPKFKDTIMGQVEVRDVFKITGVGAVAGCYVTSGKVNRNCKVRVYRDNVIVYDGDIAALKRFKDDVKEVATGFECGISIQNYNDIKQGDVFEAYIVEQIEQ